MSSHWCVELSGGPSSFEVVQVVLKPSAAAAVQFGDFFRQQAVLAPWSSVEGYFADSNHGGAPDFMIQGLEHIASGYAHAPPATSAR